MSPRMELNADFSKPVFTHTNAIEWLASPMPGVERRMLDRVGDEVARATSIVRYAQGSAFPEHTHGGGEEFIVLDGVFQDEHGDYPAGTYVRNPVGTRHVPGSETGCTIFVKLWQFDPQDQEPLAIDLNALNLQADPQRPGVTRAPLAERDYERVALEHWKAGTRVSLVGEGGAEALILDGDVSHEGESYARCDWIRLPAGQAAGLVAGKTGAQLWIKRDHLRHITTPGQVA
ncbi:MAG: cupin domain-containing protein [Erythrobacter sp.]|uniref:cupin domain-containing protein n=1 Tax=Erythrobacter sp. TaxID=1042 RepID=UPI0026186D5B|nr:cupin domain-containing protein [Erythrobacter sp.]MDJ0977040.1 cupin domain-containing protein [Erythrobacter sp.]